MRSFRFPIKYILSLGCLFCCCFNSMLVYSDESQARNPFLRDDFEIVGRILDIQPRVMSTRGGKVHIRYEGDISQQGKHVALHYGEAPQQYSCSCKILVGNYTQDGSNVHSATCSILTMSNVLEYWMLINSHLRKVVIGHFKVELFAPKLIGVESDSPELHTSGRNLLTLHGTNFGILGEETVVTYGEKTGEEYLADDCLVTNTQGQYDRIQCLSAPGYGRVAIVKLKAAHGSAELKLPQVIDYARPVISQVHVDSSANQLISPKGGDLLIIWGRHFGDDTPRVKYFNEAQDLLYYAEDCKLTVQRGGVECYTVPGTGSNLKVQIQTAGSESEIREDTPTLSYMPPVIKTVTLDVDQKPLSTAEGGVLLVWGKNFGRADKHGKLICGNWQIPYRFTGECVVPSEDLSKLRHNLPEEISRQLEVMKCFMRDGVGALSEFQLEIQGVKSPPFHSNEVIQFAAPVIQRVHKVSEKTSDIDLEFSRRGGEPFLIEGTNLGPKGTSIRVQYSTSTGVTHTAVDCQVVTPHRSVQCYSTPGSGKAWEFWLSVESTPTLKRTSTNLGYEGESMDAEVDGNGDFQ